MGRRRVEKRHANIEMMIMMVVIVVVVVMLMMMNEVLELRIGAIMAAQLLNKL